MYRPALDGLRALAVLLVMCEHLYAFAFPSSRFLPPGGYLGVDLFFVLSGFLITSLLLDERARSGGVSFRRFYRRRAFRLFPALAAFIVVQAVASQIAGQSLRDEVRFWIGAFTYTTNWVMAREWMVPANTGHLWSLSVEEQFYLFWPIVLVLAIRRWGLRIVPALCAAGVAVALASRLYLTHRHGVGFPFVYLQTQTRMDALLLGALVAWARHAGWRPPSWIAQAIGWVGVCVVASYVAWTNPTDAFLYERGGYTLLALAGTAVLIGLLDDRWIVTRLLGTPLPVAVGKLSYSLYIWHMLVLFTLLGPMQRRSLPVATAAYVVATFALAIVSYLLVERPLRALGHEEALPAGETTPSAEAPAARRWAWAMAGAGVAGLVVLAGVPAHAARDDIVGRDQAVAAALDQQRALAAGGAALTLTVETPWTLPNEVDSDPDHVILAAVLLDSAGGAVPDQPVHFESAAGSCSGLTDDTGRAACAVPLPEPSAAPEPLPEPSTPVPPVPTVTAVYTGERSPAPVSASWP